MHTSLRIYSKTTYFLPLHLLVQCSISSLSVTLNRQHVQYKNRRHFLPLSPSLPPRHRRYHLLLPKNLKKTTKKKAGISDLAKKRKCLSSLQNLTIRLKSRRFKVMAENERKEKICVWSYKSYICVYIVYIFGYCFSLIIYITKRFFLRKWFALRWYMYVRST